MRTAYWVCLILVTLATVVSLPSSPAAHRERRWLWSTIFVPFFIVPKLDFLFWSWFKAFIQYSFIPVIAFAFLMVFERFVFQFLTTLPPGITEDQYMIYGLQAFVIIGVFVVGILLVPSLTSSIFSGRGGETPQGRRFLVIGGSSSGVLRNTGTGNMLEEIRRGTTCRFVIAPWSLCDCRRVDGSAFRRTSPVV